MTEYGKWKVGLQFGPVNTARGSGALVDAANAAGVPVYWAASDSTPPDIQKNPINIGNFISTEDDWGQRYDLDHRTYPSYEAAHLAWQQFAHDRWAVFKRDIPTDHDPLITALSLENEQRGWVYWTQENDPSPPTGITPGFTGWADCEGWQAYYTALEILKEPIPYKYFAFAYSGGNPEIGAWEQPGMRAYLELCAEYPDQFGVALHEYSFNDDLFATTTWGSKPSEARGYHIFRFQYLHDACDKMGIRRPQIQIKEFGFHERHLSSSMSQTKTQLIQAAEVYSQFENIEGVALWTVANGWGDLGRTVEGLIPWLEEMYVTKQWVIDVDVPPIDPGKKFKAVELIYPQEVPYETAIQVFNSGWEFKRTIGASGDHALAVLSSDDVTDDSYAEVWEPHYPSQQSVIELLEGAGVTVVRRYLDQFSSENLLRVASAQQNMLLNPFFIDGWIDDPDDPGQVQIPNNWDVRRKWPGQLTSHTSGLTGKRERISGRRKQVHKVTQPVPNLPEHEWPGGSNELINSGHASYKMQGVYMVAESELLQTVNGLIPGAEYEFSILGKIHYHPNENSIGEPDDIVVTAYVNDSTQTYLVEDFPDRNVEWTVIKVTGVASDQGIVTAGIRFETMFLNSRDLFVDTASLVKVGDPSNGNGNGNGNGSSKTKLVELLYPQEVPYSVAVAVFDSGWEFKRTIGASADHAVTALESSLASDESYVEVWEPQYESQQRAIELFEERGITVVEKHLGEPVVPNLLKYRPCDTNVITQRFGENPEHYEPHGLPGHGGIDYAVANNLPYYAAQDGIVVHASNQSPSGGTSNYGYHVYVRHQVGEYTFHTLYAHAKSSLPVQVNQTVKAGDIVGYSGNTGNSSGYHLHFGMLSPEDTGNGYPMWTYGQVVDPEPFLEGKNPPPPQPEDDKFSILRYLKGDGRLYELRNANGGQERAQTHELPNGEFRQTKNANGEQLFIRIINGVSYICRGWDTSPGGGRYYDQQEPKGTDMARWMPEMMAVGNTFSVSLWVQFYNWNCTESSDNSGQVTDTRKLVAHYDTWVSRAGITLNDVIKLEWVNGGETYFYALDYGLVGWERTHQDPHTPEWSAISEIHGPGQRPDNVLDLPHCL